MVNHHKLSETTHSVLFVCTANQCRSPMAMALFCELIKKSGLRSQTWKIESAGCQAFPGLPATSTAQYVIHKRGLDLSHHRSQLVSQELLNRFSLILCMEKDHKAYIQNRYPIFSNHIYLLSEMNGQEKEIADPVGQSPSAYENTAKLMLAYMTKGFESITRLSSEAYNN